MIIAIDGPAASGKGTLAKKLSERLNFGLLDTGLLYRAVGMRVLRGGGEPDDESAALAAATALIPEDLEADDLRSDAAAVAASKVAAIPAVRAELLSLQRDFAAHPRPGRAGSILDGRDIGTVVCPQADAKIFVTASMEVRANRRFKELRKSGFPAIYADVLEDIRTRDERDRGRAAAPLAAADDAFELDTDALTPEEVLNKALQFLASKGIAATNQVASRF